ncbi:MAG: rod shape-determining protein MreC [bacterium]
MLFKPKKPILKYISIAFLSVGIIWILLVNSSAGSWVFKISHPFIETGSDVFLFVKSFLKINQISQDNIRLGKENLTLLSENIRLKEVELENVALRKQLSLPALGNKRSVRANISGFDPFESANYLTIDKGAKDGIKNNLPVLSQEGFLVGRIEETNQNYSKIITIFSPKSSIAVIDQETRSAGVLKGNFGTSLALDLVPQYEDLKQGDILITSSMGGIFPKGIVVGKVGEVASNSNDIFKKAEASSFLDLRKLEVAVVILEE